MFGLSEANFWQVIGVALATVAVVIPILIYRWQRQRRSLTYTIQSVYPLLNESEELHGRLSVQIDGERVSNVEVMFLEFKNSGNRPIAKNDFDTPLSVYFEPPVQIFSAAVVSADPENLGIVAKIEKQEVVIAPLLLNPRDQFTLKLLLSSDSKLFDVNGRIVGVRAIEPSKASRTYIWCGLLGVVLLVCSVIIIGATSPPRKLDIHPLPPLAWFGLAVGTIGYFLASYSLVRGLILSRIFRFFTRT